MSHHTQVPPLPYSPGLVTLKPRSTYVQPPLPRPVALFHSLASLLLFSSPSAGQRPGGAPGGAFVRHILGWKVIHPCPSADDTSQTVPFPSGSLLFFSYSALCPRGCPDWMAPRSSWTLVSRWSCPWRCQQRLGGIGRKRFWVSIELAGCLPQWHVPVPLSKGLSLTHATAPFLTLPAGLTSL